MSLRSYLIPQGFPDSRIPPIPTVDDNTVPSTATHGFAPPLHLPDRIPIKISLDSDLPCKIHALLSDLLSSDKYTHIANAAATNRLIRNYGTLQDFCEGHRFHVSGHRHDKEPSVTELAANLANPVRAAYRDLTGEVAISDSQVRTTDGAVKSDRTYSVDDKVAILWEDKALPVFRKQMMVLLDSLQNGNSYFRNVGQQSWEGVEAILAKIAYHAMNQEKEDRPCWSIIFGGDSYMILFLEYIADANNKQRIAISCSDILSTNHDDGPDADRTRKLPVCSAIVYMLLTTHDAAAKKGLMEKLGVRIQKPPLGLPDGLGRRDDGRKYSTRLQQREPLVGVQGPGSTLQILSLVGAATHRNHDTNNIPHIFLDQLWGPSSTAVIYKSSHAGLVVKFSNTDRQESLRSQWSLLAEKQVYEHLKDESLSFIPRYYGLYSWPGGVALVISDEGESLADTRMSFKELSWWTRKRLFASLCHLHRLNVCHGDFEPRNVVRSGFRVCIIDFSHSSLNHACPGSTSCTELEEAWHKLELGARRDEMSYATVASISILCGLLAFILNHI